MIEDDIYLAFIQIEIRIFAAAVSSWRRTNTATSNLRHFVSLFFSLALKKGDTKIYLQTSDAQIKIQNKRKNQKKTK